MENIGGTESSGETAEWTDSRSHFEEEHVPSSEWSEDSYAHYLRVDLPGISMLTIIAIKIIVIS